MNELLERDKRKKGANIGEVNVVEKIKKDSLKVNDNSPVTKQPWQALKQFTAARIGLGRAGISVPTEHLLAFQLNHAQAQDAVHEPLNVSVLLNDIETKLNAIGLPKASLVIRSQVTDRMHYLQRPDLGRRLDDQSVDELKKHQAPKDNPYDLAIVLVDGLSSLAIQKNAPPLIKLLLQRLAQQPLVTPGNAICHLAPLVVVQQGRVAVGDEVAQCLNAKSVLVMVGERPGLSSPDSLGMYLTWAPKVGLTDESRNCISNIRPAGLEYTQALNKLWYLLSESHQRKLSGVNLKESAKEQTGMDLLKSSKTIRNFLIS